MSELSDCSAHLHDALTAEMKRRASADGLTWITNELRAITNAANEWASTHGLPLVNVEDVEEAEGPAIGHYDYSRKFALYVAELLYDQKRRSS